METTLRREKSIDLRSYHGSHLMYIVLHLSVCGLSGVGVVLLEQDCMADATFDCTQTLNVIAKLAPGLNMIQHQNVKHYHSAGLIFS